MVGAVVLGLDMATTGSRLPIGDALPHGEGDAVRGSSRKRTDGRTNGRNGEHSIPGASCWLHAGRSLYGLTAAGAGTESKESLVRKMRPSARP